MSFTEDNTNIIDNITKVVEYERITQGLDNFCSAIIVSSDVYEICKYHENVEVGEDNFLYINGVAIIRSLEETSITKAYIPLQ